jgi:hypothetical protein
MDGTLPFSCKPFPPVHGCNPDAKLAVASCLSNSSEYQGFSV